MPERRTFDRLRLRSIHSRNPFDCPWYPSSSGLYEQPARLPNLCRSRAVFVIIMSIRGTIKNSMRSSSEMPFQS